MPSCLAPSTSSSTESPTIPVAAALVGPLLVAAHPLHDLGHERDPDLVVVYELGVPLDVLDRTRARLVVERGVEAHPEALPHSHVALGTELGPRSHQREVDVE